MLLFKLQELLVILSYIKLKRKLVIIIKIIFN